MVGMLAFGAFAIDVGRLFGALAASASPRPLRSPAADAAERHPGLRLLRIQYSGKSGRRTPATTSPVSATCGRRACQYRACRVSHPSTRWTSSKRPPPCDAKLRRRRSASPADDQGPRRRPARARPDSMRNHLRRRPAARTRGMLINGADDHRRRGSVHEREDRRRTAPLRRTIETTRANAAAGRTARADDGRVRRSSSRSFSCSCSASRRAASRSTTTSS